MQDGSRFSFYNIKIIHVLIYFVIAFEYFRFCRFIVGLRAPIRNQKLISFEDIDLRHNGIFRRHHRDHDQSTHFIVILFESLSTPLVIISRVHNQYRRISHGPACFYALSGFLQAKQSTACYRCTSLNICMMPGLLQLAFSRDSSCNDQFSPAAFFNQASVCQLEIR